MLHLLRINFDFPRSDPEPIKYWPLESISLTYNCIPIIIWEKELIERTMLVQEKILELCLRGLDLKRKLKKRACLQ